MRQVLVSENTKLPILTSLSKNTYIEMLYQKMSTAMISEASPPPLRMRQKQQI